MLSTSRSSDALVGQTLDDRYEVVRRIARGGMATVYEAHDLRLSRTVALKVMHEGLGDDGDFARKFDGEARAAAHLTHPNVVSVFDQGTDRGRPYIVMEYVDGCTLRQLITREAPMDPLRVLDLMEPVVAALAAAHASGMIHRDVKPENVLISDRGQIKVADFGLARAVTAQSSHATTGLVIGTVSYIAPELVTKGHADPRSDVYSVGIVLYEMLTGHKPHTGDTPIQVAYSHVHNQIPAPSLELSTSWRDPRAGIPPYLDALVTTAAARERGARPADARVLHEHLRAAREALARGVANDPALTARMRRTVLSEADTLTRSVPRLAASVPLLAPPREVRFTASTPVSPTFDVHSDGIPYYSDAGGPMSPVSAQTRSVPTVTPTAPPTRPRKPPTGRVVSLLVALLLVAGVAYGGWYWFEGRWTDTPTLARLTQPQAQARALKAGLTVTFEREYSEDVPVGQVTRTEPGDADRILKDGSIVAYVSRGPERYPVPDVTGRVQEEAVTALVQGSLAVGTVSQAHSDTVAFGVVISQGTPAGTQVKRGVGVDLVVSRGPAPVDLQDFTGRPAAEAKAWLEQNGLKAAVSEQHHDTAPSGSVISQTPPSGTLKRGDTVQVLASLGPVMVKVPAGLRGKGAADATTLLEQAGFRVEVVRVVQGGLGLVLSTDPTGGTLAPKGSTVTLRLV